MAQKEQIILYRFGELGTTDNIFYPLKWIARKMNLFYQTVVRIVRQYKLDNCQLIDRVKARDRIRENCRFTERQEKWITAFNTLRSQKNLTLEQRCDAIKLKWPHIQKITRPTLANIYKRHGVGNFKPGYKFCLGRKMDEQKFLCKKQDFLKELWGHMR